MIILIARIELEPEALPALKPLIERTMRLTWDESDCLSYSAAIESEAAGVVTVVERWRSEAALTAYLDSPAMREFHDTLQPAIVSLDARIYDVGGERPLRLPSERAAPVLTLVHGGNGISPA